MRGVKTITTLVVLGAVLAAPSAFAQSSAKASAPIVGNAQAGAKKISNCIGCHGIPEYKTAFPVVYRVPKIAGQNEKYLANALVAYRNGERSHPSMKGIASALSDQDIADLAAYYAQTK